MLRREDGALQRGARLAQVRLNSDNHDNNRGDQADDDNPLFPLFSAPSFRLLAHSTRTSVQKINLLA